MSDLNWDTRSRQNNSQLVLNWMKQDYEDILSNKTRKIPSK